VTFLHSSLSMAGQLVGPGLLAIAILAIVVLVVALVAVFRCDRGDISAVIEAFGSWWPWRRRQ
jgi:hypothetical protein